MTGGHRVDEDVKRLAVAATVAYARAGMLASVLDQTVDELRAEIAQRRTMNTYVAEQESSS